jgi:glycosyltransferase involved in cell wall biosynthesis
MALRLLVMVPSVKLNPEPGELGVGGAERMALQLCRNFDRAQIDPQLAVFKDPGRSRAILEASGLRWHLLRKRGKFDPVFWFSLRALIVRERFDAVLSLLQGTNVHNLLVTPTVRGVACLISYRAARLDAGLVRVEGRLAARADSLIVPAEPVIELLDGHYLIPRERMVAIPNGCDESVFTPSPYPERQAVRAGLGLPDDAFIIYNPNRIDPVKGHDICAEALAGMREELAKRKVLWLCTGSIQDREFYERVVQICEPIRDHVRLLPHTPEPQRWLAACDALCISSRSESFGLAVMEGGFVGRPFAGSATGIAAELGAKGYGFLAEPGSAESLRAALQQLLATPEADLERMGSELRDYVRDRYSIRAAAWSYGEEVERAVRRRRRQSPS